MKSFRVGIDSYSLDPLKLTPFEVLDWVKEHGGDGVQFTEWHVGPKQRLDEPFLRDLARQARDLDLYLEWGGGQHIPFDTTTWQRRDLAPILANAARQAATLGTRIVRSCSGGLMRWRDDSPPTETLLRETAQALKTHTPVLRDHNVVLAIELHFEFTTFELLRLLEMSDAEPGGPLGICLDTMNPLTMLEDPVSATERILSWVVAVHAKDGALMPSEDGLISFPAEVGAGTVDFERVLARLATLDRQVHLSIEDHGGSFSLPIYDSSFLAGFPDLTPHELSRLVQMSHEGDRRVRSGQTRPVDRSEWPRVCEERVARDIVNLKALVERTEQPITPTD